VAFSAHAQSGTLELVLGNTSRLCLPDTSLVISDSLPHDLSTFRSIYLFSSASNTLSEPDVDRILTFLNNGGGLYTGGDNWPLQAESNQITHKIYKKESFGSYSENIARGATEGNLKLQELESIPAGRTTAAFPMDYRLRVEAWIADQPLIQSGNYHAGRIVIDMGYSRFYCELKDKNSDAVFLKIQHYLKGNN
jgi:hypothetical protein